MTVFLLSKIIRELRFDTNGRILHPKIHDDLREIPKMAFFIYQHYYAGRTISRSLLHFRKQNISLPSDRNFWLRLEKSNQGSGYYTEGWQVKNILDDSQLIVTPARLRMKFQIYCSRFR